MTIFHSFYGWVVFHCLCVLHLLYSHICWLLTCLCYVNNAAMNIGVHISFWISIFIFFGYTPRSGIAGYMVVLFLIFWGISIVFFTGAIQTYTPNDSARDSLLSHSHQHLLVLVFLNIAILTGVRCHCGFDLHLADEHLLMCLLTICMSSLENCLFRSSVHFLNWFFFQLHHMACGIFVPQPGIKPLPPASKVWSRNHWTTREVLFSLFWVLWALYVI